MTLVDEVKARLTIVDVVSDYVALENTSSRTPKALCPFHDERTPSFSVSIEHDSWRCWGACGEGGDMFAFVMRADGVEFREALEKLARKAGIDLDSSQRRNDDKGRTKNSAIHEVNTIAEQFFARQLEGSQGAEALAYLESRGIDAQVARRRGIGFAPSGVNSLLSYLKSIGADSQTVVQAGLIVKGNDGGWRDMFMNRITIAIRDQRGNIVGFGARAMGDIQPKYLNTAETAVFNKSALLYGLHWAVDSIRATGRAIVVEGYMDVLAAQERGFKNVVACMGTAVTSQQLQTLSAVLPDDPDNPPSIILCLDADEAGQQAKLRGTENAISEWQKVDWGQESKRFEIEFRIASPVVTENGIPKDPDEAIRNDRQAWLTSIDQAEEFLDHIIRTNLDASNIQTENGLDNALSQIERFFWTLPPRTIKEQRKLASVSERLGIELEHLTQVMLIKRAARHAESSASGVIRRDSIRLSNINTALPMPTVQAPWEINLLACMVQYDYSIDHTRSVEPYEFSDPTRTRVFDSLKVGGSIEACIARIEGDDAARELVDRLQQIELSPTDESFEDQSAVIQIAEESAKRTHKEYLTRLKKREVQQAKENGNMIRDEDMINAVKINREIRELVNPQHAGSRY